MNDKELIDILSNGGEVPVPYFNGKLIRVEASDYPAAELLQPLKNFLSLSNEQRLSDGRHLVAYCKLMVDAVGPEVLDDMGGEEPTAVNVWNHATVTHIFFGKLDAGKYASEPTAYVQIEGNVAWEPEHGLQMSWADGRRLVKVGAFDGHPTNGHASANVKQDQYVFSCYKPDLCTFPDPV